LIVSGVVKSRFEDDINVFDGSEVSIDSLVGEELTVVVVIKSGFEDSEFVKDDFMVDVDNKSGFDENSITKERSSMAGKDKSGFFSMFSWNVER